MIAALMTRHTLCPSPRQPTLRTSCFEKSASKVCLGESVDQNVFLLVQGKIKTKSPERRLSVGRAGTWCSTTRQIFIAQNHGPHMGGPHCTCVRCIKVNVLDA